MEVEIRPACEYDTSLLLANLREIDRKEVEAAGYDDPAVPVMRSFEQSALAWSAWSGGRLIAMFGVAPLRTHPGVGVPWLLATEDLAPHARVLASRTSEYISLMLTRFPRLVNMVWAGHTDSVRWLRKIGFKFHPPVPHPQTGEWFSQFEMKA